MIFDKQNLYSENQAITATAVSENVIDLGAEGAYVPSVSEKGMFHNLIQVTVDFAGLTGLTASIETSVDEAFTSPIEVVKSAEVAAADLKAGYRFGIDCMKDKLKRYVRIKYTVNGTATAGKVMAGVVLDTQINH